MRHYCTLVLFLLTVVTPAFAQNITGTNGDVYVTTPPAPYTSAGVLLLGNTGTPDISARLGTTTSSSDFSVFDSAGTAHFKVLGDGKVLVGKEATANPLYLFTARSETDNTSSLLAWTSTTIESNVTQNDIGGWLLAYQNVSAGMKNGGTAYGARARGWLYGPGELHGAYGAYIQAGLYPSASVTGNIDAAVGAYVDVLKQYGSIDAGYGFYVSDVQAATGYGLYLNDLQSTSAYGVYQLGANDVNYFAGKVGIGTNSPTSALQVTGDVVVSGTITAGKVLGAVYQDVAEWVPATTDLAPGTVVILNPGKTNEVMASQVSYDTTVAGVVSAQPGVLLGTAGEGKEQIATTGRVKVRVDARNGAVRVGDLLVTSDLPGTAMKSEPMAIAGRRFHQPGTIIGKALEPLESGVGEILVLLSMQ